VDLTTLFIRRPVMTTLVMVAILVFGIVAYDQLPVSDLPNVDFPTITVTATLPGTAPQTMAATVATPLEKSFSTIAGIDNMTSTSSLGQTQIVVQFGLDRNINAAAQDVQAAITQTMLLLPAGIIPPSWQKTNPADAPILTLALTSAQVRLSTLDEYGETTIAQRLSMVGRPAPDGPRAARDALDRARGRRHRGHQPERQHPHRRPVGAEDRADHSGDRPARQRQ
jgi:HAE1 family hydrophobic/amphiphilic exporter-1